MATLLPLGELYLAWILGVFVLPLLFAYSPDTIVTSYWVNNDSVGHAFLIRGFEYTRAKILAPDVIAGLEHYPRGIHSPLFTINSFLKIPTIYHLLPGAILTYSMIVFAVWPLLSEIRSWLRIVSAVAACAPFRGISSIYFLFLAQIGATPLIVSSVVLVATTNYRRELR